jgi:hypothetical protein
VFVISVKNNRFLQAYANNAIAKLPDFLLTTFANMALDLRYILQVKIENIRLSSKCRFDRINPFVFGTYTINVINITIVKKLSTREFNKILHRIS